MRGLVVGAGVTGCYTAARLLDKGMDVALLARGAKAERLERDGLRMRDGMTGEERTVRLQIVRAPVSEEVSFAMVCVQEIHRPGLEPLLCELPGRPVIWFLGNTTKGYDRAGELLGRDRVLGGFPGVGGTWEGETLLFADRQQPQDRPFDKLVIGEAFAEAEPAAQAVQAELRRAGMKVERYSPIMAWHWSHIAVILPLAGAVYRHNGDLDAVVADAALLKATMRATAQALTAVRRAGYPILPRGLHLLRWIPTALGARKIASLLGSRFGQVALAGHAATAREEMHSLALDVLDLAGKEAGRDLTELLAVLAPSRLRPARKRAGSSVDVNERADYFVIAPEIVELVPEILADFDELGSEPERIADWLQDLRASQLRVLDLGCGKGAVAIALARRLGCQVRGVDMMAGFVDEAREKARAAGVEDLCSFTAGDIRKVAAQSSGYDAVLLVSVGGVFGDARETMRALRGCVRSGGYIVIDDAYARSGTPVDFPGYEQLGTRDATVEGLTAFGDELLGEHEIPASQVSAQNQKYTAMIARRVAELKQRHPEHEAALQAYLDQEIRESRLLETDVACATWLVRVQ